MQGIVAAAENTARDRKGVNAGRVPCNRGVRDVNDAAAAVGGDAISVETGGGAREGHHTTGVRVEAVEIAVGHAVFNCDSREAVRPNADDCRTAHLAVVQRRLCKRDGHSHLVLLEAHRLNIGSNIGSSCYGDPNAAALSDDDVADIETGA